MAPTTFPVLAKKNNCNMNKKCSSSSSPSQIHPAEGPEDNPAGKGKISLGITQERLSRLNTSLKKAAKKRQFCRNSSCHSKSEELVDAPPHALAYFGVRQRPWKICEKCVREADDFNERSKKAIKEKKNLFSNTFKVQSPEAVTGVIDLDSSDDEGAGKENVQQGGAAALDVQDDVVNNVRSRSVGPMYSISTKRLDKELASIMERISIKDQVQKCKATVEKEADLLSSDFKSLSEDMDNTFDKIQQTFDKYNRLVKPLDIELGNVDISDAGVCVTESEELENNLTLLDVNKNCRPVKDFRKIVTYSSLQIVKSRAKETALASNAVSDEIHTGGRSVGGGQSQLYFVPPKVNQKVYGMREDLLTWWQPATVLHISENTEQKIYKVQFNADRTSKGLLETQIAFRKPILNQVLPVGTRVIAIFNDVLGNNSTTHGKFFAGITAECPDHHANRGRYLIFFDDGYSQYVQPAYVLPVAVSSNKVPVWKLVHSGMKYFIQDYLHKYPERRLLKARSGDLLNVELYGKWQPIRVEELDCSLMKVNYLTSKDSYEWIYRGSMRLEPLFNDGRKIHFQKNGSPKLVKESKSKCETDLKKPDEPPLKTIVSENIITQLMNFETAGNMMKIHIPSGSPTPKTFVHHNCSPSCAHFYKEEAFRKVSPLAIPFYLGWARELNPSRGTVEAYISPCGVRLFSYDSIHAYICKTKTEIPIEFFSFQASIDCLNEFKAARELQCLKDISYGKEWTPVECVNSIDRDVPDHNEYFTTRILGERVKKIDDEDFLVCCDCTDDCKDKTKCACCKLTLDGVSFQSAGKNKGNGYENRRLVSGLVPSGIYECNKRCRCNVRTCFNRVVQNKVKWPVQVFKTIKKGWGVRALHDIPKGSFICEYTGRVLTFAQADEEGRQFGDEYLADLDYVEVMEGVKEGYESDCIDITSDEEKEKTEVNNLASGDLKGKSENDRKHVARKSTSGRSNPSIHANENQAEGQSKGVITGIKDECDSDSTEVVDEDTNKITVMGRKLELSDFKVEGSECGAVKLPIARKSTSGGSIHKRKNTTSNSQTHASSNDASTSAQHLIKSKDKGRPLRYRNYFGKDGTPEQPYSIDGKRFGNFGRFFNHSCDPNLFIQSVFVNTHDLRFPWVAFFTNKDIKAGTELCWDYKYEVGSVPGKTLYCYCGAPNCRKTLL